MAAAEALNLGLHATASQLDTARQDQQLPPSGQTSQDPSTSSHSTPSSDLCQQAQLSTPKPPKPPKPPAAWRFLYALLLFLGVAASLAPYLLSSETHGALAAVLYREYSPQLHVLAQHPGVNLLHRVSGALLYVLGALQFSPRLRTRHRLLHRDAGYAFVALTLCSVGSGLYFALVCPFANAASDLIPSLVFGLTMAVSAVKAVVLIKQNQVQAHREWMTRAFAVALGIAVIRLPAPFGGVLGFTTHQLFERYQVFWAGWTTSLLGAEWWIRAQRRAARRPTKQL